MRRDEAWWVRFGPSVGGEIRKQRPAVVVTNNFAIPHLNRVQVVPLTTNVSMVYPGETVVVIDGKPHKAMADQIATVSKERIMGFFGELSGSDVESVNAAIGVQLGM